MNWSDLRIGMKLAIGFGMMLALILLGGVVGYTGLKTVGRSLVVISDEEAPLVDASMEMKISLLEAMASMDEFLASTAVIASMDESRLASLENAYLQASAAFDRGIDAILNGGRLGDVEVIKTDNPELANEVKKAAELHDSQYETTARELMADGRRLLATKAAESEAMNALEDVVSRISSAAETVEVAISAEVQRRVREDRVGAAGQALLREEVPLVDMAMEMKYVIAKTRILMEEYAQSTTLSELEEIETDYQRLLADFDAMAAAVLQGGNVDGIQVIATKNPEVRSMVTALVQDHHQFEQAAEKMMAARRNLIAHTAEAQDTMARLDLAGAQAAEILSRVEQLAGGEMVRAKQLGHESSARAIFWQIIVVACSVAAGGLLGFFITRSLSRPIYQGVALADEIAKGDFSHRLNLERKDEVGRLARSLDSMADNLQQKAELAETIAKGNLDVRVSLASDRDQLGLALQTMTDSLNAICSQIRDASEQISTGGNQVASASMSLSQGATESAASLQEITSSMSEMSSRISNNAQGASEANRLSNEAKDAAEKGTRQMQAMVGAMEEINDAGQSISKIIKTIDEIAFQTNLLALNAAVEAARAGQHGKGFAVVAEEVRNLAARSAKAAEETAELIEGSVEKTTNGSEIANQTATALEEIFGSISKVSSLIDEISVASAEQAEGISQVDQGLSQIDKVTQQNTASAEESAAAAEELSGQAEQLQQMLKHFTLRRGDQGQALAAPLKNTVQNVGWKNLSTGAVEPSRVLNDSDFGKY